MNGYFQILINEKATFLRVFPATEGGAEVSRNEEDTV